MTNSELRSLDGVGAEGRASNFAEGPIVAVDQDACWFDKPRRSICRLAAIGPLLAMVATIMSPPTNV